MPTSKFSTATLEKTLTKGPDPNSPWFQGWFVDSEGSAESIACPTTQSAAFSGSYIHCCDIGGDSCAPAFTACGDGGVAPGASASVSPCIDGFSCKTLSVFKQSPLPSNPPPVTTGVFCAPEAWSAYTIYRTLLVDYAVTSTIPLTAVATAGSSYGIPTTAGSASGSSSGSSSSSNTGVIAGAAVGGVVAIAIIAALLWFFCARRKKRERQSMQGQPPSYQNYAGNYRDGYGGNYTDAAKYSHPMQEMDGTIPNSELDAGNVNKPMQQQQSYELAAAPK